MNDKVSEVAVRIANYKEKTRDLKTEYDGIRKSALEICREWAADFGFTAEELRIAQKAADAKGPDKFAPRFKNPEGTELWCGRGKRPLWYIDMKNKGYTDEDMAYTPETEDENGTDSAGA